MKAHKPKLTKTVNGWMVSDGYSCGESASPEYAYEAYKACRRETELFNPEVYSK